MLRSTNRAVFFAAALATSCPTYVGAQAAGASGCPAPGAPVVEPYRWYPALDLARIPFHSGDGPWGPRAVIVAPAAPVTSRTVNVSSAAQLAAAARIPGTLIVVDANYIGHAAIIGDVADLDIVIPPGRTVAQLIIGRYSPPSVTQRVRIRGTTPGTHSGGVVGSIAFHSVSTDVIIDGVDLNGDDGKGGNLMWHFSRRVERAAIVNVRGHAVSDGSIQRGSIVIAGNRFFTSARSREVNGSNGGYGIRGGDRLVVFDNRIDGTRYHRVRVHPEPGSPQYAWVVDNTFVDAHEARIFSAFNAGNTSYRYAAVWAVCNRVYAHSKCMPPSFDGKDADYAMLTSNVFFGSITQDFQKAQQAAHGSGRDYLTGNSFSPWQAPPAWEAPGDPANVPLPPVQPNRYNASLAFPCPAP